LWRPVRSAAPRALAFGETAGGEPHLLLLLLPPDVAGNEVRQGVMPRELIFVIDTSGSMHGVSIGQARLALKLALDGLDDRDMFNVIQFNSVTRALYPRSVRATPGNLADARQYVDGLEADGGTEMRPALELALAGPPPESYLRQVVFITDGSVGNESELFGVIEERLGDARLFTVGIGSAPNGWFMRKAAEAGRGTNVTIGALHEAGEKIARLFRKIEQPQLTGIRIEWPDSIEADAYPAVVPDLYAGEPIVLNVRLRRPPRPGDQLRITGRAPGGTWGAEIPLAGGLDAPGVAALWGRARVEALTDAESRGADAEVTRSAIVETALAHRLVTRYTSLVAVDRTPARAAEAMLKREQVPNLLPHGQSMRAIFGFPATATPAPGMRVAGSVAILLASLLLLQRVWTGAGQFRASPRQG
jgi:Ca-activated chloride channel family protein